MQIVIDIPEKCKQKVDRKESLSLSMIMQIETAISCGTVLPKGHGRLIDADEIAKTHKQGNWDLHKVLKKAPTIIEPYKEG